MSTEPSVQTPPGSKQGRRLFSLNASDASQRVPTLEVSIKATPTQTLQPLKGEEGEGRLPTNRPEEMVEGPSRSSSPFGTSAAFRVGRSRAPSDKSSSPSRSNSRRPSDGAVSTRSGSPVPFPSSRARWDLLRQRVLLSGARSLDPSSPYAQPQPSLSTSSITSPVRSPTPKPSRFARLGFRQVVDSPGEATANESPKLAEDIQRACWFSRFADSQKLSRYERDIASSSTLYLPFMTNPSLPVSANASVATLPISGRKYELWRPQSDALQASSSPSVNNLLQTLLYHAPASGDTTTPTSYLPYENQVHAALLAPFLIPDIGNKVDEEQRIAVEAFEVVVKAWKAELKEMGINRCLWCCKAASVPSTFRMRILGVLWSILIPRDSLFEADTPSTLKTLVQALFLLLYSFSTQIGQGRENALVEQLIAQIRAGVCGELNKVTLKEEYGAAFSRKDDDTSVRAALISEGLSRCLENGVVGSRRWILRNLLEAHWLLPPQTLSFTPLLVAIHTRKLDIFGRAAISLLSITSDPPTRRRDAEVIVRVLQTRVLPELEIIHGGETTEAKGHVAYIILELLSMDDAPELTRWATALVCHWYQEVKAWRLCFESSLQRLISHGDWSTILKATASVTKVLPNDVHISVITAALPYLFDQLTADPPAYPCPPLTEFLETISRSYPQLFYKPLFSCAASSKEPTVANHLCTISSISRFLPDFWTRDADMMSIALLGDTAGKAKSTEPSAPGWGKARLGQSVLLLELAGRIRSLRRSRDSSSNPESAYADTIKFASNLESRLGILLDAKEVKTWVPVSQRHIICILFLQVRLLTRSLKPAPWLSRVVSWLVGHASSDNSDTSSLDGQLVESVNQLKAVYSMAQEGTRSSKKRRNTLLLSPITDNFSPSTVPTADISIVLEDSVQIVDSLSKGFAAKALELLVVLSSILTLDDYRKLGLIVWNKFLDSRDARVLAAGSFFMMQCAEKMQKDFSKIVTDDLLSIESSVTLRAVQRINTMFDWRFQILSQHVIVNRTHRGPFKLARDPLPFVATDIGSSLFVPEEDPNEHSSGLPLELRKHLLEIGWTEENKSMDPLVAWIRIPISRLSVHQLDRVHHRPDDALSSPSSPIADSMPSPKSPVSGENGTLTRRSSFVHGSKRRAVFAPALAASFPALALLTFHANFMVAAAARNVLMDFMRHDPALLSRPIFDLLSDDRKEMAVAISALQALLHVRRLLPPAMAHDIFNTLTGFLKHASRQVETPDVFHVFADILPAMAKLVTQVRDVSIREIRRAKIEAFVIPSGSLWFSSSAPAGPMFPRKHGGSGNPFVTVPTRLASMVMIRVSQNMFFLAMLRRNAQEVQLVRKNMSRLVLPSLAEAQETGPLELKDFVPTKLRSPQTGSGPVNTVLRSLSLLLSRSYLLLIAQIFRSMSRHLSDRNELAVLIDGLNRILLVHGDDIGIVAQAMIALMVASTRFRRLFASGGGFTLFMPALVKTYSESEENSGVREAIIYTVHRFFAQHNENFVFQSLDISSHLMMVPAVDGDWIAQNVYGLFSTLKRVSPVASDAAGIHDSNKVEERDALMVSTAEEKPQAFLASLRQGGISNGTGAIVIPLPEEYKSGPLRLDNFVRLFLTVIAYDTTILRAERFLRLFRFLAPYLYDASATARSVLRDGIDALGIVLMKTTGKPKTNEVPPVHPPGDLGLNFQPSEKFIEKQLQDKSKAHSNITSMRIDYLALVVAFTRSGGQMRTASSRRTIELVKAMLKDSSYNNYAEIAGVFAEFTRASLIRLDTPSVKDIVVFLDDLAPIISAHAFIVDFSGALDAVSHLTDNAVYADEPLFGQRVITRICAASLGACERAASEGLLFTLPLRRSLISLMTNSVFLHGADVIAEVEKCNPSYEFLAGVVWPFVMTLDSTTDDISGAGPTESRRGGILTRVWIRLLAYTMSACHEDILAPKSPHFPERIKSQDKHRSSLASSWPRINVPIMAVQIVKIILIREDSSLSSNLPGIWSRLAWFLTSLLRDGNARFVLQQERHTAASSTQPYGSDATRIGSGPVTLTSVEFDTLAFPGSHGKSLPRPRMVDYSLWSLFELLCQVRTPLFVQLHLFIREKVVELDEALCTLQINAAFSTPPSRRMSSSSIFSKPRRRLSGIPSPEISDTFDNSQQFSRDISAHSPSKTPPPSYPYQSSPTKRESSGHHMIHLGHVHSPTRPTFGKSTTAGVKGSVRVMSKSLTVKSPFLVRATYQRIRLVQSRFGYDSRLLPLSDSDQGGVSVMAWTKRQALEVVVKETEELIKEFEETSRIEENDRTMVDSSLSVEL